MNFTGTTVIANQRAGQSCTHGGHIIAPEGALALREVQVAKAIWLETARISDKPIPRPQYRPAIYQLDAPPQFATA